MSGHPNTGLRTASALAVRGRAPAPYRVLITGSRTWRDHAPIHATLDEVLAAHPDMVLISGACKQGVDAIGERWAILRGIPVERHPAQWRRYGNSAGYRRNTEMVQAAADLCLAFIALCAKPGCDRPMPHGSHGAEHCAHTAELAGIPIHPHRPWKTTSEPEQLALGEAP